MEDRKAYVIKRTLEGASLEDVLTEIQVMNNNKGLLLEEVKRIAKDAKKARKAKKITATRKGQVINYR